MASPVPAAEALAARAGSIKNAGLGTTPPVETPAQNPATDTTVETPGRGGSIRKPATNTQAGGTPARSGSIQNQAANTSVEIPGRAGSIRNPTGETLARSGSIKNPSTNTPVETPGRAGSIRNPATSRETPAPARTGSIASSTPTSETPAPPRTVSNASSTPTSETPATPRTRSIASSTPTSETPAPPHTGSIASSTSAVETSVLRSGSMRTSIISTPGGDTPVSVRRASTWNADGTMPASEIPAPVRTASITTTAPVETPVVQASASTTAVGSTIAAPGAEMAKAVVQKGSNAVNNASGPISKSGFMRGASPLGFCKGNVSSTSGASIRALIAAETAEATAAAIARHQKFHKYPWCSVCVSKNSEQETSKEWVTRELKELEQREHTSMVMMCNAMARIDKEGHGTIRWNMEQKMFLVALERLYKERINREKLMKLLRFCVEMMMALIPTFRGVRADIMREQKFMLHGGRFTQKRVKNGTIQWFLNRLPNDCYVRLVEMCRDNGISTQVKYYPQRLINLHCMGGNNNPKIEPYCEPTAF